MEFVPILLIMATVKKIVDLVRYLKAGDTNGWVTQLVAWAAGFAVVALAAHTPWAAGLDFGGHTLAGLGLAAQLLVGIAIGSATSAVIHDTQKAADGWQSAAVPPLIADRQEC